MTQDCILLNFRNALVFKYLYVYKSVLVRREFLQEMFNVQFLKLFHLKHHLYMQISSYKLRKLDSKSHSFKVY